MAAQFGRRLRRGAATTAIAAAAMAALAASQAPTALIAGDDKAGDSQPDEIALEDTATGGSPYYTDLPPLTSPGNDGGSPGAQGGTEAGIPATVLAAYKKAAAEVGRTKPGCNLEWQLLAAIGKVESGHARGGAVDAYGTTRSKILGPVLSGGAYANIADTDNGLYDDDSTYDRAVGPMQFIPGTWATWGADGNADGRRDPNNIYDAALAAGNYLCAGSRDVGTATGREAAILSYNPSREYVTTVLYWYNFYKNGAHSIPDGTGTLPRNRSDDPSGDGTPGGGGTPSPTPPTGGGGSTTPPPSTPPPTADPALTVATLLDNGTGALSTTQGHTFGERVSVKAATSGGGTVIGVKVRFTIVGTTDTRFSGGAADATVTTGAGGVATAPGLVAGEQTGDFTVRATVVGNSAVSRDFAAGVSVRLADALARVDGGGALSATASTAFGDGVQFKATDGGTAVAGTAVTVTVVASAENPDSVTDGPYFKDGDGNPVRTRELQTDASGVVSIPQLYANATTGSFALKITAAGGATEYLTLTVVAAPDPTPDPTTDPTTDPSTDPTSSPSSEPSATESSPTATSTP
ncbi:lytic transglycosylase domain-containing protein [Streptomyces sp. NPDC051940]|uniref:lytic transglycosylase domain-containing protein n=1 Tax=Streptomyces sp. NPDC051940 TaxID=3155675 RepID=UPI003435F4CB